MRAHASKQKQPQPEATPHTSPLTRHTIGNQAVPESPHLNAEGRGVKPGTSAPTRFAHDFSRIPVHSKAPVKLQAKLTVNTPGDIYEQEADRISEQVMRMPEPQLQRACACGGKCSECQTEQPGREHERLLTKRAGPSDLGQAIVPPIVHEVLRSPGQPLASTTRRFFEPRFGHTFGSVRVHADARAAESARAVRARAYTAGRDIVFGRGEYAPTTAEGRQLLAHELAHVVQQSSEIYVPPGLDGGRNDPLERAADLHAERVLTSSRSHLQPTSLGRWANTDPERPAASNRNSTQRIQRQEGPPEEAPLVSDDALLACLFFAPLPLKPLCFELTEDAGSEFKGGGGRSGGGGATGSWSPDPAPQVKVPPTPAPAPGVTPPSPPPPAVASKKLNFYHGTRWSIAKTIPNNVKAIGGGDFATGFYTHQDADDRKAEGRAIKWGIKMANIKPVEPYAGVIRFGVPENDYRQIRTGDKLKSFDLTRVDQPDFKAKQKAWLDFITSTGRKKEPVFKRRKIDNKWIEQWVHERRATQPNLAYNIVEGPFYTPIRGTKDKKPPPEEFKPYAEGKQLPQQVAWANEGIKLLNSAKVDKELKQYDAKTGKHQDPPVDVASTAGQLDAAQVNKEMEEAQMEMVR